MQSRNRIIIGQFVPGVGLIYRLDPRTKILAVLAIMVTTLAATTLPVYLGLIFLLILLLFASRLGPRKIFGNLKPVLWFVAITALFHFIFSGHDDPDKAFRIGSFAVSKSAVNLATIYSSRIVIFVLATFLVSLTTSPLSLSEAIVSLMKPLRIFRIPVYDLGMILFIALRFIPVLTEEIETIRKAQFIRGIDFSGGLFARIKRVIALILPVFFSAFRRADDLSVAIETRGYVSGQPRSSLYPLKFAGVDIVILGITIVLAALVITGSRGLW